MFSVEGPHFDEGPRVRRGNGGPPPSPPDSRSILACFEFCLVAPRFRPARERVLAPTAELTGLLVQVSCALLVRVRASASWRGGVWLRVGFSLYCVSTCTYYTLFTCS